MLVQALRVRRAALTPSPARVAGDGGSRVPVEVRVVVVGHAPLMIAS
jgi:hypothetical protein